MWQAVLGRQPEEEEAGLGREVEGGRAVTMSAVRQLPAGLLLGNARCCTTAPACTGIMTW